MQTVAYKINPFHGLIINSNDSLVLDAAHTPKHPQELHIQALVRSGDYFAVLATELDAICAKVQENDSAVVDIQRIVRDLLYVQSEYQITKK